MNHYFTHFDELFASIAGLENYGDGERIGGFSNQDRTKTGAPRGVNVPSYPHSNVYVSSDRNTIIMDFAVAGYNKEDISVTAGKNSITVEADRVGCKDGFTSLHAGISGKSINFTMNVDDSYDTKKAKVYVENGILSISLPKAKDSESIQLL